MIKHVSSLTNEKILETIQEYSNNTNQIIIISGYITLEGFKIIERAIIPEKIKKIIVGVFTEKAKDAFEYIEQKYPEIEIFIYRFIGHKDYKAKSYFTPILHAKIVAGFTNRKIKWAYTGSANITSFALDDKNIESGMFVKVKNKELDEINSTIKKISNKSTLINYKLNKNIYFTQEEKYVHNIDGHPSFSIPNTYLVVINDYLANKNHDFIGIYCNQKDELLRLRNDDKILFYFKTDRKIILNRVLNVGEKVYFPQNYISFYIENINNEGFKTKYIYDNTRNPDVFIIVENIKIDENIKSYIKKIGQLLDRKPERLIRDHIEFEDPYFFDKIIIKETKSTLKSESIKYLKNNQIIDITKLEIEKGDITTLKDLLIREDLQLYNKHFPLNKIKKA